MTLLDIEKLLDMTHHMSVHIPIELIISWEQSEEAWSVKDNCLNGSVAKIGGSQR